MAYQIVFCLQLKGPGLNPELWLLSMWSLFVDVLPVSACISSRHSSFLPPPNEKPACKLATLNFQYLYGNTILTMY